MDKMSKRSCATCMVKYPAQCANCQRPVLGGYLNNWMGKTTENKMEDSGKRQQFDTGAVRDTAEGKSRPDLISPYAQLRKGDWLRLGAEKYDERNWEKGMKISRCIASICRHLFQYMMGSTNEDHLAAIAVNAEFIMHYEAMIERNLLPKELDDLPKYEQQIEGRNEN